MHRSPALDNAKFVLMYLVILGHLMEPVMSGHAEMKALYLFIYVFHMPAFVLVTGMAARRYASRFGAKHHAWRVLVPFVVFSVLYELLAFFLQEGPSSYLTQFQPHWILWFLWSLFLWRLLLPLLLRIRFALLLTVGLSLVAGYLEQVGYFLGLSRTLYFLPFFLAGYLAEETGLVAWLLRCLPKGLLAGVLVGTACLCWLLREQAPQWLFGSVSYQRLGFDVWWAAVIRLVIGLVSLGCALAVLALLPQRETGITQRGSRSLAIYLWHGFVVIALSTSGALAALMALGGGWWALWLPLLALAILGLLSAAAVANLTDQFLFAPIREALGQRDQA